MSSQQVALLVTKGDHYKNQAMSVVSFSLAWLTDCADSLEAGDEPLNQLYRPRP